MGVEAKRNFSPLIPTHPIISICHVTCQLSKGFLSASLLLYSVPTPSFKSSSSPSSSLHPSFLSPSALLRTCRDVESEMQPNVDLLCRVHSNCARWLQSGPRVRPPHDPNVHLSSLFRSYPRSIVGALLVGWPCCGRLVAAVNLFAFGGICDISNLSCVPRVGY